MHTPRAELDCELDYLAARMQMLHEKHRDIDLFAAEFAAATNAVVARASSVDYDHVRRRIQTLFGPDRPPRGT